MAKVTAEIHHRPARYDDNHNRIEPEGWVVVTEKGDRWWSSMLPGAYDIAARMNVQVLRVIR